MTSLDLLSDDTHLTVISYVCFSDSLSDDTHLTQATKGVSSVCITDTGALGGKLLGIVTKR